MPFYDAGDAAIYYEITGSGPPLLLMHGYALNSQMWEFQVAEFSKTHTVINVDLRGFGQSSCGNQWGGTAMAGDIVGLIKHLDLKDTIVTGFSLSGGVAIRVGLELPDSISKLLLVSSILPSAGNLKTPKESERHRKETNLLRLRGVKAWADGMGLRKGPLVDKIFTRNPAARPVWEKIIARHNPDFLLQMMDARHNTKSLINWRERLKDITQKTFIVVGSQDSQFIDAGHYLNRNIPNSEMKIISDAGHMLNLEKPDEFNSVVSKFLN